MSKYSKIEWTDVTWSPVTGCTPISEGCQNCYAERMAKRLAGRCGYPADEPFSVTLHPERLDEPLRWKKPSRIFVCSMGDLFHDDVQLDFIDRVFAIMALATQHTFIILTKRPQRMKDYIKYRAARNFYHLKHIEWPLPKVWLGVTVENQQAADERIPILLQTPAVVRFVSCEPLLGLVDLTKLSLGPNGYGLTFNLNALTGWVAGFHDDTGKQRISRNDQFKRLNWVIVGGETGPGARPMHPDWVRSLQVQCQAASVAFFFKQWGEWEPWQGFEDDDCPCGRGCENSCERVHFWGYSGTGGPAGYEPRGVICSVRVGKKKAGRLLDDRTWDEYPVQK